MKQQQQQQIPQLQFDTNLLQTINEKCLKPNETIRIQYYGNFEREDENDPDEEPILYEVFHIRLYVNGKVASHIELMFSESEYTDLFETMIISSTTQEQYLQYSYNTILRCVISLLMSSMKIQGRSIVQVVSNAQNYLSVYSLAKLGFVVEESVGFSQKLDLSFYSPFQQTNSQQQRVVKQKTLKQYVRSKYENPDQDFHEVTMVLLKKNYHKSSTLAKNILNRLRGDCLLQTRKRKHSQQQKK